MEHTLALIEKAHEGDKAARDTLAEENMGLVWSMVGWRWRICARSGALGC